MKIYPVGAELFRADRQKDGQTEGQTGGRTNRRRDSRRERRTDTVKLLVAFPSFEKGLKMDIAYNFRIFILSTGS